MNESLPPAAGGRRLGRVPGFDGLRALAVLAVVFHNADAAGFQRGGVVGVTTFFVLSGYLLTRLLLEEAATHGTLDWRRYGVRRALRIMPALAAYVGAIGALQLAFGNTDDLGSHLLASITGTINWPLADGAITPKLTHLWSVAIELQSYLVVIPVLVLLARRLPSAIVAVAGVGLAGASLVYRLDALAPGGGGVDVAYYATFARIDAVVLGGIAAIIGPEVVAQRARVGSALLAAGLYAVAWTGSFDDAQFGWGPSIVAVATVFAIFALVSGGWTPLSFRPLVAIGVASYSIYLWHFVALEVRLDRPGAIGWVGFLALTAVVSTAAHVGLERPMGRIRRRNRTVASGADAF